MVFIPGIGLGRRTTEDVSVDLPVPTFPPAGPPRPPGPPGPAPPDLLVKVTATAVIHDFNQYYPGVPIDNFQPNYSPLPDGSLVCPPLIKDLLQVHAIIIICAALFIFFFRNTFTVIRYVRSSKVPHNALFYMLLWSQVIGFAFPLPTLISVFIEQVDCRMWVVKSLPTQTPNAELPHSQN